MVTGKKERKRIELTRERVFSLAQRYREGDEPLPQTVERIMERYDSQMSLIANRVVGQHLDVSA